MDFWSLTSRSLFFVLLGLLAGCRPNLALPAGAQVSCDSSVDCGDWICDKGRCVSPDALAKKCQTTSDCDDQVFCNGEETCEKGFCVSSLPPCGSSFDCVVSTCVESADGTGACHVAPAHERCGAGTYCSPTSGCVEGQPCLADEHCQDGAACNGSEVCFNYHCVPGLPVDPEDGNPCTVDFCSEPGGPGHLPDGAMVRAPCRLASDGEGAPDRVCSADGECLLSRCGDEIVDPRTEACDDSNDDPNDGCHQCSTTSWAPQIVTGLGRHRGDPKLLTIYSPGQLTVGRDGAIFAPDNMGHRVWQFQDGLAFVVAGEGTPGLGGDGEPAPAAKLKGPISVAVDGEGNLYVADNENDRIRYVDARTRRISTLAGDGTSTEEGAPANGTLLHGPDDLAVDGLGNVYFIDVGPGAGDSGPALVRRIDARTRRVYTVAGSTSATSTYDGPALEVRLDAPASLALDGADTLYIGERTRIRKLVLARPLDPASGTLSTVAGGGTSDGDGPALSALVTEPPALAVDSNGDLYFADQVLHAVRRVRFAVPRGPVVETVIGDGSDGLPREGPVPASAMPYPQGLAFAPDGSLIIGEYLSGSVLRVTRPSSDPATWTITRLAGGLKDLEIIEASPATTVRLWTNNLAVRGDQLYFTDIDRHVVWKMDQRNPEDALSWRLSVVAGGGTSSDENAPVKEARFDFGNGEGPLAFGPDGALYVGVTGEHRVRRIVFDTAHPDGIVQTVAGSGSEESSGDGGPALAAGLDVTALAFDSAGRLFIADYSRVRVITRVDPDDPATWTIDAAAGSGERGASGDGGPALEASFAEIWGVTAGTTSTGASYLFVSDWENKSVRGVALAGAPSSWTVFRAAGTGVEGFSGDGGPACLAELGYPAGIDWYPATNSLLVTDRYNNTVRKVTVTGPDPTAWTVASLSDPTEDPTSNYYYGDGGPLAQARVYRPREIAVGDGGVIYLGMHDQVRRVDVSADPLHPEAGRITTILGGPDPAGDGMLVAGGLGTPRAIAQIDATHFALADGTTGRVRWIDLSRGEVRTVAGYPGGASGPGSTPVRYSRLLETASGIAWDAQSSSLFVTESEGHALRRLRVGDLARPWTWTIEDFAGKPGEPGHADGALSESRFFGPTGLAFDPATRTLYVAEAMNQDVRAILVDEPASAGCVTTVAGVPGHLGFHEGPAANEALFHGPAALALDHTDEEPGADGIYVADTENHRVRRIDLKAGTVRTVLGTGQPGSSGVGAPATSFPVDTPSGLAVDSHGNLFVSSRDTIREVTANGADPVASGLGRVLTLYGAAGAPDIEVPGAADGAAPRSVNIGPITRCLTDVLLADDSSFYALDQCQGALLRFARGAEATPARTPR